MIDLILHNARIVTQWPDQPLAQAIAVQKGRIIAVGSDDEILALASPGTRLIDARGRLALPAFTDAHIHLFDLARRRGQVALYEAASLDDLMARVQAHARTLPPDAWVLGYGWNESAWPERRFPTRHDLDAITGGRPAVIWRTDLHAAVANTEALRRAGIGPDTPNPPSGVIDRDESGQPTGVLRELAINLLREVIPPMDEATAAANLQAVAADLHRLGIIAAHDQRMKDNAEEGPEALRLYQRLAARGELPLRVSCNLEAAHLDMIIEMGIQSGFGDEWVRFGHVKLFSDGSLGARTAWMLESYENDPDNQGMFLTPPEEMSAIIQKAHRHGVAISIHAIGDRANRTVLDIFDEAIAAGSAAPPLIPHRIEHVQTIQPEDQPRLAQLGLTASVQPIHCTDDIPNTDRLWGDRGRNTYPFRNLLNTGTVLAFGSDAPVASPNPWWGIHAAVTRQRRDGSPAGGWYPDQRLSVEESVRAYTIGPAIAIGQAHQQGRLAPGYLADLILLDRDIFAVPLGDLPDTRVLLTLLGGKIVFSE
jgi:predicted amidohydrolase YtcJ